MKQTKNKTKSLRKVAIVSTNNDTNPIVDNEKKLKKRGLTKTYSLIFTQYTVAPLSDNIPNKEVLKKMME